MRNHTGKRLVALLMSALMLLSLCAAVAEGTAAPSSPGAEDECLHLNRENKVERSAPVYASKDDEFHEATVTTTTTPYCQDCLMPITAEVEEEQVTTEEAHRYRAGADGKYTCADCSHVCTHAKKEDESFPGGWCEVLDEEYHVIIAQDVKKIVCTSCNATLEYDEAEAEEAGKEKHDFDENGWCTKCEANIMDICEHEAPDESEMDNPGKWSTIVDEDYVYIDEETHRYFKQIEYTPICEKCGAQIYEGCIIKYIKDEAQPHEAENCPCGAGSQCEDGNEHDFVVHTSAYSDGFANSKYEAIDAQRHKATGAWIDIYQYCHLCGYGENSQPSRSFDPDYTLIENHSFEEGVCWQCGYENVCEHTNAEKMNGDYYERTTPVDTGNGTHIAVYAGWASYHCYDCEEYWTEDIPSQMRELPHEFGEDGKCTECGAKWTEADEPCPHENVEKVGDKHYPERVSIIDELRHSINSGSDAIVHCLDCGETFTDYHWEYINGDNTKVDELHTYDEDNMCIVCGYTTECTHENMTREELGTSIYREDWDESDATHDKVKVAEWMLTCEDCGLEAYYEEELERTPEKHDYEKIEGEYKCRHCRHTCRHSNLTETEDDGDVTYIANGDLNHEANGVVTVTQTCPDCGYEYEYTKEVPDKEAHSYKDGVCEKCGHKCSHWMLVTRKEVFEAKSYASNGAKGHTATGDMHVVFSCDGCGKTYVDRVMEEGVKRDEAHTLKGGKCTLCGYVVPKDDEAEETAKAVVTKPQRMAVILVNAVKALEAKHGEAVEISIVNIDKLLTADELAALEALPMAEQVLVALKGALSMEIEADYALEELGLTLSDDALALIETVSARIAAMTAEEKAAYDAQIAELFELEPIDGANAMVLALEIATQDETRTEGYIFCEQEDGTWTLHDIDVTEPNA